MLLRHTPNEITERKALSINPAKTCQPIGAMYADWLGHGAGVTNYLSVPDLPLDKDAADRAAMIFDGRIIWAGAASDIDNSGNPYVEQFVQGRAEGIHVLRLPEHAGHLSPIVHTIPLQLLAYHVAVIRGTDVDKPRNLAKSVTVE